MPVKIASITVNLANGEEVDILPVPTDTIGDIADRIERDYYWTSVVVTIVRAKEKGQ
jgi:hypothetical protein